MNICIVKTSLRPLCYVSKLRNLDEPDVQYMALGIDSLI